MAKPRYTADPPVIAEGMSIEEKLDIFIEWTQNQVYRIDDFWPEDFSDRLDLIEALQPFTGVWPIVDFSYVTFTPSLAETASLCDFENITFDSVTPTPANDFSYDGGVSLDADGEGMILGGGQRPEVSFFNKSGGSWSSPSFISQPSGEIHEGFGQAVSHSEATNILVVGCPRADLGGTNTGAFAVYSGSTASGFTYVTALAQPGTKLNRGRFGYGLSVSDNGLVLAVGAPGTSGSQETGRVYFYDWVANAWVYRNYIEQTGESGFGWDVELNNDGTACIVGYPEWGTGATGRVEVYDDVSGVFTQRQIISRPSLTGLSLPGDWFPDGDNARFGTGLALVDSGNGLVIQARWKLNPSDTAYPCLFTYKLNTFTNQYEFCELIYDPAWVSTANGAGTSLSGLDAVFSETVKQVVFNATPQPEVGTSRFTGRVYNFT